MYETRDLKITRNDRENLILVIHEELKKINTKINKLGYGHASKPYLIQLRKDLENLLNRVLETFTYKEKENCGYMKLSDLKPEEKYYTTTSKKEDETND